MPPADFHIDFPLKELLFALRGIPGEIFQEERGNGDEKEVTSLVMSGATVSLYFHPAELEMVKKVLAVASNYMWISRYMEDNPINLCAYKSNLLAGINDELQQYIRCLNELQKWVYWDDMTPLSKFMLVLKYETLLETTRDLLLLYKSETITANEMLSKVFVLSSAANSVVRASYQAILLRLLSTFYDDIWSWMIYGYLRTSNINRFCVREVDGVAKLIATDVPSFLTIPTANKIFFCGHLVRHFRSIDRNNLTKVYDGKVDELFEELKKLKAASIMEPRELGVFVEKVRRAAAHFSSKYIIEEERLMDEFQVIKDFFLTGNENLWILFVTRVVEFDFDVKWSADRKNRRVKRLIQKTLVDGFYKKTTEVTELLSKFRFDFEQPTAGLKTQLPVMYMEYTFSPLLQRIFKEHTFKKYHKIFNFLLQLYRVRYELNERWRDGTKRGTRDGNWFLRHKLTIFLEHLYYFLKVNVIERLSQEFVEQLKACEDYEAMEVLHQSFILNILRQSLLDIAAVETNLYDLLRLCHDLCSCNFDVTKGSGKLQEDLERNFKNLYYLLTNLKVFQLSPTLSHLIFQISGFFTPMQGE